MPDLVVTAKMKKYYHCKVFFRNVEYVDSCMKYYIDGVREFFIDTFFNKTLVNALIVPADKNKMVIVTAETLGCLLGEGFPLRRKIDHTCFPVRCALQNRIQTGFERLSHHHTAPATAIRIVIYLALFVLGIIADLDTVYFEDSFLCCPAENALMEDGRDGVREERQNINTQEETSHPFNQVNRDHAVFHIHGPDKFRHGRDQILPLPTYGIKRC